MLLDPSANKKIETQSGLIDKNPKRKVSTEVDAMPDITETPKVKKPKAKAPEKKKTNIVVESAPVATDAKKAMAERMAKLREAKNKKKAAMEAEPVVAPAPEKPKRVSKKKEESAPVPIETPAPEKPKRGRKKADAVVDA
jgi:hypothetical protein